MTMRRGKLLVVLLVLGTVVMGTVARDPVDAASQAAKKAGSRVKAAADAAASELPSRLEQAEKKLEEMQADAKQYADKLSSLTEDALTSKSTSEKVSDTLKKTASELEKRLKKLEEQSTSFDGEMKKLRKLLDEQTDSANKFRKDVESRLSSLASGSGSGGGGVLAYLKDTADSVRAWTEENVGPALGSAASTVRSSANDLSNEGLPKVTKALRAAKDTAVKYISEAEATLQTTFTNLNVPAQHITLLSKITIVVAILSILMIVVSLLRCVCCRSRGKQTSGKPSGKRTKR